HPQSDHLGSPILCETQTKFKSTYKLCFIHPYKLPALAVLSKTLTTEGGWEVAPPVLHQLCKNQRRLILLGRHTHNPRSPAPPKKKSFAVPDLHDAGRSSFDKAFADEYISSSDDKNNNVFTLKPANWGGIATPANNEQPNYEAPRPQRARSVSMSSIKGDVKIIKEQDEVLRRAWKAVRKSQKNLKEVKENFGLLNEFGIKTKKVHIKSDLEENDITHLSGSRAPRHNDQDTPDQLGGPNSQQGPKIIDGHNVGNGPPEKRENESISLCEDPVKQVSRKQIKNEIKRLKQLAKLNESKNHHHDGRCKRRSVEPMSFEMANMVSRATEGTYKKGSKGKTRSASVKASEQVNPKSYLGKAFKDLSEDETSNESASTSDSDSGGSDPSDSSSFDNGSESLSNSPLSLSNGNSLPSRDSGDSDEEHDHKYKKSQKKSKAKAKKARTKSKKRAKAKRSTLKPMPPDKYNGSTDPVKFVRFINQCNMYLKRGKVLKEDEVAETSNFLTDKAYDYYLSDVSMELRRWKLPRFFKVLFNTCFPANFCILQQDKLDEFSQGSLQAHEYSTQLKNLFHIVGYAHKHEKVRQLWKGLVLHLCQKLFEAGLDPEKSKWGQIVDHAEMSEIVHNMGLDNKNKGQCDNKNNKSNSPGNSGGNTASPKQGPGNGKSSGSNCNCNNQNHKGRRNQNRDAGGKNTSKHSSRGPLKYKSETTSKVNKNKLGTEELKKYHDEGLCYRCGESGHIGHNCDKGQNVKGGRSGPPGVRSNNIEYLNETERLQNLASTTESVHLSGMTLHAAAIMFQDVKVTRAPQGCGHWRRDRKGSHPFIVNSRMNEELVLDLENDHEGGHSLVHVRPPHEIHAEYLLQIQQPYPGDSELGIKIKKDKHFEVYGGDDDTYHIYDKEHKGPVGGPVIVENS
ncbi:hypothetical protein DXG01_005234, partial [Tephrocybe rancida]